MEENRENNQMISVSIVSQNVVCKMPAYLYFIERIKGDTKSGQVLGIFEHETRRMISEELKGIYILSNFEKDNLHEADSIIRRSVREVKDHIQKRYKCNNEKLQQFEADLLFRLLREEDIKAHRARKLIKQGMQGNDLIEILLPYKTEYSIESQELGLSGKIDAIYRSPYGFIPVDYKTGPYPFNGKIKPIEIQLTAYAMLLESKYKIKINYGIVHFTELFWEKPIVFTENLRGEVRNLRESIINLIECRETPKINQDLKCERCSYEDICKNYISNGENHNQNCSNTNQAINPGIDILDRINISPGETFSLFHDSKKEVIR